jgi:hypothetical protein
MRGPWRRHALGRLHANNDITADLHVLSLRIVAGKGAHVCRAAVTIARPSSFPPALCPLLSMFHPY